VPEDVVILNAGDVIPGDGRILDLKDLFVTEVALTGETFPVEKSAGALQSETPLARCTNCLFLGTSVLSGMARLVVVRTGSQTEFGRVSEALRLRPPETEFEHGIRRFGYLLLEVTLLLVLVIFVINVSLARPVPDAFLFALAIAVGLPPQLLPAIISSWVRASAPFGARGIRGSRAPLHDRGGSGESRLLQASGTTGHGKVESRSDSALLCSAVKSRGRGCRRHWF
jgi:Mg2+-importing ATPase